MTRGLKILDNTNILNADDKLYFPSITRQDIHFYWHQNIIISIHPPQHETFLRLISVTDLHEAGLTDDYNLVAGTGHMLA